ncbi:heme-binding protein [Synechocystis sp. FACHB-383]|uniref:GlcG/HbpS family heme-binding protein n=1 Tax=unclassified Synechocystis TaxID=2640012 RepID=UPI001687CBD6|nr:MULTISPECIES: heme-binding protein [unclassified Synechocystis]MBD2655295.1 heme-binding protein [Synechocystis sp. FACHB-383]MBE9196801.1 heme-binding protein [Synechocystis sp. LEGE 06083]
MKLKKVVFQPLLVLGVSLGLSLAFSPGAFALKTLYQLPFSLAVEAAMEAVNSCQGNGYNVTATVVNQEGLVQAVIRGDGATPHTIENSLYKAYTVITLGPITKEDSTEAIAKKMTPAPLPVGSVPLAPNPITGLSYSTGGLAIKVGDQLVAAIGVSGSPNGNLDQACALQGIEKIKPRLIP